VRTGDYRVLFRVQGNRITVEKLAIGETFMRAEPGPNGMPAQRGTAAGGRPVVTLAEDDTVRLLQKADEWEPVFPLPDADGNCPAVEYVRASLARKIIRRRRSLGLTHAELAARARIRLESLYLAETGRADPSVRIVDKIFRALQQVEEAQAKTRKSKANAQHAG
jgi:DNA-binding XRE family transcriptional regulator